MNTWDLIIGTSVFFAIVMVFLAELFRWISHVMTRNKCDEREWISAAEHLRWALRLSRTAHALGILALLMQQSRIESIRDVAVDSGVAEAAVIASSPPPVTIQTASGNVITLGANTHGQLSHICGSNCDLDGSTRSVRSGNRRLGDGASVPAEWSHRGDLWSLFAVDALPPEQSAVSTKSGRIETASRNY
mgnify:CR=1 FL=1